MGISSEEKARRAALAANIKTVTIAKKSIDDGIINADNVDAYLEAENLRKKPRVMVYEMLTDIVKSVNIEEREEREEEPEPEEKSELTIDAFRLEGAEMRIADQVKRIHALESQVATFDQEKRQSSTKHAILLKKYREIAAIKTIVDGTWEQIIHLTGAQEFCFGDRAVFEKWAKTAKGRAGFYVDVYGPNAWMEAHRHAPGGLMTLNDGTVRVKVMAIQQARLIEMKLLEHNQRVKKKGQGTDQCLDIVVRETASMMTLAFDASQADGFGVRNGLAILRSAETVISVMRDESGQVTGVRMDTVRK